MKTTVRFLPTNLSDHCPPIINLMIKERHQHLLGARQLNTWHIQLVLRLPRFCIYGVYQHQIKNIWGKKKIPERSKTQNLNLPCTEHFAEFTQMKLCVGILQPTSKYHTILYKGPEHLETFVREYVVVRCPGTNP